MRHVDTLSTIYVHISILNYLQNHCLWRKNGQKLVLYYLENSKLPKNHRLWRKKRSKLVLYYPENHWKIILASHVQCLHQKRTSTGLPACLNGVQHKDDILPIRTCGDFYMSFVYRYCHEQSSCRIVPWIFRQLIISTIDNSTIKSKPGYSLVKCWGAKLVAVLNTWTNMCLHFWTRPTYMTNLHTTSVKQIYNQDRLPVTLQSKLPGWSAP